MNLMGKIDNILKNDLGLKICATHLLEKKKKEGILKDLHMIYSLVYNNVKISDINANLM